MHYTFTSIALYAHYAYTEGNICNYERSPNIKVSSFILGVALKKKKKKKKEFAPFGDTFFPLRLVPIVKKLFWPHNLHKSTCF